MAKMPSEVLCNPKSTDKKKGKGDDDKDDKKAKGPNRRNALIDFIAKNKQAAGKA